MSVFADRFGDDAMNRFALLDENRKYPLVRRPAALLTVALAALAGCHGSDSLPNYQVYEVKGRVLLSDGKPLGSGWISFVSKADLPVTPSAPIAQDGTFSLVTGGSGSGAPAGDYKVRVESPGFLTAGKSKTLYPSKYTDEDSSGIVVTVRAQANDLEPIRLK
jgi:hypothetical protein